MCINAENKHWIIVICVAMAPSSGDKMVCFLTEGIQYPTWSCCLSASRTFPSEMFCLRRFNSWTASCHNSIACSLSWQQENVHVKRQLPRPTKPKMLLNLVDIRQVFLSWLFQNKYDNYLEHVLLNKTCKGRTHEGKHLWQNWTRVFLSLHAFY